MPSLHAADAAIIGIALARVVQPRLLKVAFALWPAWVSFSLIASGNHFWLDIAAGLLLAVLGAWVAGRLTRRRSSPVSRRVRARLPSARKDAQAVEHARARGFQTRAERRISSNGFTAMKTNHRAARSLLEPNVEDAERLAQGGDAEPSRKR
jgi:membrane-associated phospholipid phosphatase